MANDDKEKPGSVLLLEGTKTRVCASVPPPVVLPERVRPFSQLRDIRNDGVTTVELQAIESDRPWWKPWWKLPLYVGGFVVVVLVMGVLLGHLMIVVSR